MKNRPLSVIASDILATWQKPYFGSIPYIQAMQTLQSVSDYYGYDSAESIVRYFLCNASTWKGEDAKRIKSELKALLK